MLGKGCWFVRPANKRNDKVGCGNIPNGIDLFLGGKLLLKSDLWCEEPVKPFDDPVNPFDEPVDPFIEEFDRTIELTSTMSRSERNTVKHSVQTRPI